MSGHVAPIAEGRLERSCAAGSRERIRVGGGAAGVERVEAHFPGVAFAPHRHDVYAIGVTLDGYHLFRYRGAARCCLPGQIHILHPDETHDGGAGDETGFSYRILYIDPALVQAALGGRPLPFVADPVVDAARMPIVAAALADIDDDLDETARIDLAVGVADSLRAAAGDAALSLALDLPALARVRDALAAHPGESPSSRTLERIAGLDRFALARQFRAAYGVSPGRFRVLRRLDRVRNLLREGATLAGAAAEAGFADQSHMTRQFKRAYGLTPARWAVAIR